MKKPNKLLERLKYHVTGAIERGEGVAIESMPVKDKYIIVDWAYNVMFLGETFKDEDAAWEYLECNMAPGELLEDFVIITESEVN